MNKKYVATSSQPKKEELIYEKCYRRSDNVFFAKNTISFDDMKHPIAKIEQSISECKAHVKKLEQLLKDHKKLSF